MQRQVIDNLIQENNFGQSEQRSKQFTINLVENDGDIADLEANVSDIEAGPKQASTSTVSKIGQWIKPRVKSIIIVVIVVFVVGFVVFYLYKRRQKKTQEEIETLKEKMSNAQIKSLAPQKGTPTNP